jgi:SlyX protein
MRTVDDLSDIVARQDIELSRLSGLMKDLTRKIQTRNTDQGDSEIIFRDERPPHY